MNLAKLAKLKEKLIGATDFFPVMDHFMTEFGESDEFLRMGQPTRNAVLEATIREAGKQVFTDAESIDVEYMQLIELPGYHFIHGGFFLNNCVSSVFYFEDLGMGMMAVATSMAGETRFVRFSTRMPAPSFEPSQN